LAAHDSPKSDALQRLRIEYEDRIRQLQAYEPVLSDTHWSLFSVEYDQASLEALKVEREVLIRLRNESVISDEVLRHVQRDIDLAEARILRQL
jgi:CPA1 family monovalent cation:H+ antiporter